VKLHLDTHTLLWAVQAPAELSATARLVITDPDNEVFVSAIVAWELSLKERLGKLPEAGPLVADFPGLLSRIGFVSLPLDERHAVVAGQLDWDHRDPFDRMLAAQALIEGATLVSLDHAFDDAPGLRRLW
jgi:PIN domain nuclease of toxin-antitoxin system